jgi:lipopolysaccharide export system protein LptA
MTALPDPATRDRRSPAANRRPALARSASLLLSLVIAAAVVAGIAFVVTRGLFNAPARQAPAVQPIEVEELLSQRQESGRGMIIQIMDKQDPTRLASEVLAERFDPDGPSHRLVEKPRAWLFGRDGSAWHIEADNGRFFIPEGEQSPREGFLRGDVRARRYDPTPGRRPNPDTDTPTLTATTDQPLHFNLDLLQFETEGRLVVLSDQIEFTGRGVFVVLNEQRESISWLRVDRGERLVYTPAPTQDQAITARPAPHPPARNGLPAILPVAFQPAAPQTILPKIDHYRIIFKDRVRATHGPRIVRSDSLTIWTRLVDNKIPERQAPASAALPMHALPAALARSAPALPASPPAGELADEPDSPSPPEPVTPPAEPSIPLVLTWEGPMEIAPLAELPAELTMGDDLALRFEVAEGHVEFEDSAQNARGRALAAAYFAGRERVELSGSAGSIELSSPDSGRITGVNTLYIELAAGVVTAPTPGELLARHDPDAADQTPPQRIAWRESASFAFALEEGRMTDRIERAGFAGEVRAVNRDASLTGDQLDALFDADPGGSPRLVQLNARRARADDGRGGLIAADRLEAHFTRGTHGEEIDPTRVILTGDASARRTGRETISADHIDAALARDDAGEIIVVEAEAEGAVRFSDGAGVEGRGDTLWTDAIDQLATITGEDGRVSRLGSAITGGHIEMDAKSRRISVAGPGSFVHADPDEPARTIHATWTERMRFDDRAGRVECEGGTSTESVAPDGTRDTVLAERLEIELDPFDESTASDAQQRLRRAVALGGPEAPAIVESRRPGAGASAEAPRFDEILRLEGGRIHLAARENRLEVPGPGKLFILDRRPESAPREGATLTQGGQRGTTLFTWNGSLAYDRALADAVFLETVRVAHKPLGQADLTELFADRLIARFTALEGETGDLRWAEALGDAVLRIESRREIAADRLLYHAERGLVEAVAPENGRVEVTDLARGTTSGSRAIRWDLVRDTIEIINPASVVSPN